MKYRVWATNLYLSREIKVFVSEDVLGPVPEASKLSWDKTSCRIIEAPSPRKAARHYVRQCLPMMIYLAQDGPNEPHDLTHAKPGLRAAEMRHYKRLAKRYATDRFGRLQFQLV